MRTSSPRHSLPIEPALKASTQPRSIHDLPQVDYSYRRVEEEQKQEQEEEEEEAEGERGVEGGRGESRRRKRRQRRRRRRRRRLNAGRLNNPPAPGRTGPPRTPPRSASCCAP